MNLFLLQAPNSVLGTKIVLNKQSDLILHGAEIVAPTGIVEADIDGLVSHFTQIEQTISDSGSQLNSGIDNEASIRLAADQSLAADLAAEKGRIDVILDGSTVDLDQFREVVDFVQSIDLENDESLLNAVVNINQNIDNVIGDFESADSDILDQLSTLTIYTENQVDILTSGLEQEIQDRTQAVQAVQDDLNNYKDYTDTTIIDLQNDISMADESLATSLSSEVSSRISGDESLATSLSSEVSSRISGDESLATLLTNSLEQNYSQLSSDIAAETSNREATDTYLAVNLSAEISRAIVAEGSLLETIQNEGFLRDGAISAEASLRISGDDFLYGKINEEESSRISADLSLQNQIDFITNNTDAAALDSLTEIVAAFQSADGDINNAITNLAAAATTDLSVEVSNRIADVEAEESRAISRESDLQQQIADTFTHINNADNSIASDLSFEIATRIAEVSNEVSLRISSDVSLYTDLTTEIYDRIADVDAEEARATSVETVLSSGLSVEISNRILVSAVHLARAISAEDSIIALISDSSSSSNSSLSVEISLRIDADTSLESALSAEISRAEAAEDSLEVALSTEVSYLVANTDLGSIDSFAEVVADLSTEVERAESVEVSLAVAAENFVYNMTPSFKEVTGVIDGLNKVFTSPVIDTTSIVFLNGLLQREGRDYQTLTTPGGFAFSFINAPQIGDVVDVYGCPIGVSF